MGPMMTDEATQTNSAMISKAFAVLGGLICIVGGIGLAGLKAQGANSLLESIANGMGYYFIGKGLYMISMVFQLKAAVENLIAKNR
jgi:hypothetical protein